MNSLMDAQSPAPLVNTDYRIKGGLDTPQQTIEDEEADFDLDYRMNRFNTHAPQRDCSYDPHTPAPLAREGNGRKRHPQESPKGWDIPRTVWAWTGGAAIKVASFAWNTGKAFTGFRAGGGQAYKPGLADQSWMAVEEEKEDPFDAQFQGRRDRTGTPIPGEFPDDRYIEDYMDNPTAHHQQRDISTPTLQGTTGSDSTLKSKNGENWVFVQPEDTRDTSPTRRHKKPLGYASRPASRASLIGVGPRPKLQPRPNATNASYASPRAGTTRSAPLEDTTTYQPGHRRSRSSIASPRRESTIPMSPDVLKFEKKVRQKEKKIDSSMRRLNSQLEDMIREGKEALGTRIEVRDTFSGQYEVDQVEDLDEGYAGSDGLRHYDE